MLQEQGNFNDLKMIVSCLRKEEVKLIREQFGENKKTDRVLNGNKLFDYLIQNQDAQEEKARNYLRESKNAFTKTVSRLLERLDYILVSESNIVRNNFYSYRFRTLFDITTKLLLAEYYRTKGIQNRAGIIVNQAIEECKSIEEYGLLLEFLNLKFRWYLLKGQKKEANLINEEILHFEYCRNALSDSINLYYELGEKITRNATRQIRKEILEKIEKINEHALKSNSAQIQYYNLMLKFNVAVEFNQIKTAQEIANSFFTLVTQNDFLNKKMNIGIANLYIADAYLVNREFELSLKFSEIAKQYFEANTYNYFHTEELEFYSLFFLSRYEDAEEKILSIINNTFYTKSNLLENKKEYLLACVYFAQERFHECVRLLNSISEIPKDKTGWNFGIKNLTIMLTIIRRDYDSTVRLVDSYERDLKRIRRVQSIRKRDLLIFKLFKRYARYGNSFAAIESLGSEFNLLASADDEYTQIIPGHEMIAVNEWFNKQSTLKHLLIAKKQ